jgi:hypothetical protein
MSEHYRKASIQPIEVITDWGLDFPLGNTVKYIGRHRDKGGIEDLIKASWYLTYKITGSIAESDANTKMFDRLATTYMTGAEARMRAEQGHDLRRIEWPMGLWVTGKFNRFTVSNIPSMVLEGDPELVKQYNTGNWQREHCANWETDDWQIATRNGRWMNHFPCDPGWVATLLRNGRRCRSPRWDAGDFIQIDGTYHPVRKDWNIKAEGSEEFRYEVENDPFFLMRELVIDAAMNNQWEVL